MDSKKFKFFLPIRSIAFILIFLVITWITKKSLEDITSYWSIIASCLNIWMIIAMVLIFKRNKMNYFEFMNIHKGQTSVKKVILYVLLYLAVGMGGMYLAGLIMYQKFPYMAPMMIAPISIVLAVINVFVLPITTTIVEDGIYLGMGTNAFKNKYVAVLVPAFFYALQHCFIPTLFNFKYIMYRFLSFLPLTIIICYIYKKNKNPLPLMIGHLVINLATVAQILLTSCIPGLFEQMMSY